MKDFEIVWRLKMDSQIKRLFCQEHYRPVFSKSFQIHLTPGHACSVWLLKPPPNIIPAAFFTVMNVFTEFMEEYQLAGH